MQLVCLPIIAAWITFFLSHQVYHLYTALCLSGFAGKKTAAEKRDFRAQNFMTSKKASPSAFGSFMKVIDSNVR